jgi:hypothetical protein
VKQEQSGFVNGALLLELLFPEEETRPTMRWLRKMTATRSLPFIKIGNRSWFNVADVRRHIEYKYRVSPEGCP